MRSSVLELVRPVNCALSGGAVVIAGAIAASGATVPGHVYLVAFFVAAIVAAGGNAINDYFDREIDKVNRPDRPIPSKRIAPDRALKTAQSLFIAGILLSILLVNVYCFFLAALNSLVLVLYSGFFKRRGLPGNISIGYLVGSTFLFGGLSTRVYAAGTLISMSLLILVLMAALSTMGRELIKAIEDMPGDKKMGFKTLPLEHGHRVAAVLAVVFILAAIMLSPIPYIQGIFGDYYLYLLVPSIASFLAACATILAGPKRAGVASLGCKIGMGLGLFAFLAGTISLLV